MGKFDSVARVYSLPNSVFIYVVDIFGVVKIFWNHKGQLTEKIVRTGSNPSAFAYIGNEVFVASGLDKNITVIDIDNEAQVVINTIVLDYAPTALAAMTEKPILFIASSSHNLLSAINSLTGKSYGMIYLNSKPLAIATTNEKLFVTLENGRMLIYSLVDFISNIK